MRVMAPRSTFSCDKAGAASRRIKVRRQEILRVRMRSPCDAMTTKARIIPQWNEYPRLVKSAGSDTHRLHTIDTNLRTNSQTRSVAVFIDKLLTIDIQG